jgi:energy-coupling factor transporter ATP-binding protein EcfA2
MELPPDLKQALERLRAGITDTADLETLRRALQAGQIVLATGERAVAIGGSVEDTVIVTVDNNIVFKGATAESVREALQQVLERIASDRYAASLQAYFRALRRYCAELPYLTLTDIRPPKNLDEIYVPLRARQREKETLPPKPAAQGASLTVEQVLRQAQTSHLLILGQPGAGKSTLLRQLAERAYDAPHAIGLDRPHLPLLLPLRALAHAEGALEERLNQALQNELRLPRPLPDGFLDAWPQQLDTPWLFLLDGLDEVPADSSRSLRQWISDLLTRPDVARVIITSRPSAYIEKEWESSRLSVYEIQPFTPAQTAELARRWFGEDAPALLQALETVRSSVLTETPLLVTIAAKVYLERKSLPERRSQLYQEFVDIWLDEARERGLRDELDAAVLDLAQPTLAHLALAMTDHPDWTDEKSLIPVMAEYLNEQLNLKARAPAVAERFLRVMARRSGVFLKREERYEWVHPSFREYLASRSVILEARGNIDYLFDESVSMLFGRTGSIPIVAWILDSTESSQCSFFIPKILRKLNEFSSTDFGLAREEILFLAIHLSEFGNLEIIELFGKSDYFDSDLRFRMALILEFLGDAKIAQEIFETLANDDNAYEDIRVQAAEHIAEHSGIGKVMHTLIQMAHTNTLSRDFRVRAVECLQNHGCFDEASLCWVNLAKDPNIDSDPWHGKPWVRRRAIDSLFHLKRVNELIELAQDKKLDSFVRFEAARFLGILGYIDKSIAVLTDMLFDTTEWLGTRREVAYWLEKFAQPTHLNVLQNLAIQEQDDEIRRTLLQAIARMAQTDQQGDEP